MNKNRPTELNKKIKRLRESRDGLKLNNRGKNLINQKLRDRNVEITESRDLWKSRHKELGRQKEELQLQVQTAREEAERERIRADEERERADKLQAEIETVWGKKSRA
jgi:hypothetical protein